MRKFGRELGVFAIAVLATFVATWPLGLELFSTDRLADRTLDDHVYWWDFWWLREALLVRHVDPYFCSEVFWPHGASLVVSPFALPFGLLSLPFQLALGDLDGAVVAVKVIGFLTFPFAIHGTSLFLRGLGVPLIPSLLAGALFAFTPFRMLHLGRIHYLAGAFVPWFLHAARQAMVEPTGKLGPRLRRIAAAGLWFAFAGAVDASLLLELTLAAVALWAFELARGASWRKATLPLVACGVAGALFLSPLLVRFVGEARANAGTDVASRLEYDEEPASTQRLLSPDFDGMLWYCSPALHESALMAEEEWTRGSLAKSGARLTADLYEHFRPLGERADLEAAAAVLVLLVVAVAVACGARERGAWAFLLLALVGFALALGPKRGFGDDAVTMPYAWLAKIVPGMAAGRYPPAHLRLFTLGIAVVAGLACARPRGWLVGAGGLALAAFLTVAPLRPFALEPVRIDEAHERIARDPTPGAVLELPPRREIVLRRMALGQILHHRPLMSGPLTRVPASAWSFFTEEPAGRRILNPPVPGRGDDPELAREIAENKESLARHQVRFIIVRRALLGADPNAGEWLLAYLGRHGFAIEPLRDGHVLVRVGGA